MPARLAGLLPGELDEQQTEVYRAITGGPRATGPRRSPSPTRRAGSGAPVKWKAFFTQAKNDKYLRDGDVVELSIRTPDGTIDLGTQQNKVRFA